VLGLDIPPERAASSTLNFVVWKKMEPATTIDPDGSDVIYVFVTRIDGNLDARTQSRSKLGAVISPAGRLRIELKENGSEVVE
jgi:hypothetical protein